MTAVNRRAALGSTLALCSLPAMNHASTDTPRDAAARKAIETYARAWERGDIPALLDCYHADFTLNYFGRNGLAGRHAGKAASLKVLGEMRKRTDRRLTAITAVMAGADRAAMLTRETMTASGQTVEVERLYVYTVAGEQLLECWVYDQDQRLVDGLVGA